MHPLLVSSLPSLSLSFFHLHLHICYIGGAFGAPAAGELSFLVLFGFHEGHALNVLSSPFTFASFYPVALASVLVRCNILWSNQVGALECLRLVSPHSSDLSVPMHGLSYQ